MAMRWNRFIISVLLLLAALGATAQDSIQEEKTRYDKRVDKAYMKWTTLIPKHYVIQNAGNMGWLSVGIGWNYGKRQHWETELLVGFIPKHQSSRTKATFTLKENYLPWSISLGPKTDSPEAGGWSIEPLQASLYINTVYGNEFWKSQPHRYPDKYYEFMSTKFRLNLALGQRFTWHIPMSKRNRAKSISLFYEVSTCDYYIRSKFLDSNVPLKDILGLSIGLKLQML